MSVALKPPKELGAALKLCSAALGHMEAAARHMRTSSSILEDIANRHAWLADVYRTEGDHDHAMSHRLIQEHILNDLVEADQRNMHLKNSWITLQRILSWMEAESGHQSDALARLQRAIVISDQLIAFDPTNKTWNQQRANLSSDFAQIKQMPSEGKRQ